jgi:hypothetical protein
MTSFQARRSDVATHGLCLRTTEPLPRQTRHVVHGTPITPASAIAHLKPTSFCISFWNRRNLDPYLDRLAPDGQLLLDNGAYTAWRWNIAATAKGRAPIVLDNTYWRRFYSWAAPIIDAVPQASLIIPDAIDGSVEDNRRLILEVPPGIPLDRCNSVYHLGEPLSQLAWIIEGFGSIALGSSGVFHSPGTTTWRQRIDEVMETIERLCEDPANGQARPRTHIPRGLAPMRTGEFAMTTGDATNLARNWKQKAKNGIAIADFQAAIERHSYRPIDAPLWPDPSTGRAPAPSNRRPLQMPLFNHERRYPQVAQHPQSQSAGFQQTFGACPW